MGRAQSRKTLQREEADRSSESMPRGRKTPHQTTRPEATGVLDRHDDFRENDRRMTLL